MAGYVGRSRDYPTFVFSSPRFFRVDTSMEPLLKEGDRVKRGQIVGLSGATGRATGPHLHVAVQWQGTYLDPASLLRLKLP